MKRKLVLLTVVILAVFVMSCATLPANFKATTYRTLATAAAVYIASWGSFEDAYLAGIVNEQDYQVGLKMAQVFYAQFIEADKLAIAYFENPTDTGKTLLEFALKNLNTKSGDFKMYLAAKIKAQKGVVK